METKNMTCVVCPRGCALTVTVEDGKILSVTGNTCKRGAAYAEAELLRPERMLTSTIPKDKIFDAMRVLYGTRVSAPVQIGDVIVADVCGTGVDVIASESLA